MTSPRRMLPTGTPVFLVLLLALGVSGPACRKAVVPAPPPAPKVEGDMVVFPEKSPQLGSIAVEEVSRMGGTGLPLTGRLTWDEDVTVRVFSPVAGRVGKIAAAQGQRVAAGALLAEISSPDFGQAQADAARAAADLATAQRNRDRAARLVERGAVPRKDLDNAEADLARAGAEERRTSERLSRWGGGAGRTVDEVYRLTAALPGTVVDRAVNPGLEVRPDATAPLFVVTEPARLWVLLDVTEADLAELAPGARITVRTPAYPGREFAGTLDLVGDALDPATRTVKARGRVDNASGLLKAEMYVGVEVTRKDGSPTALVPARSVLSDGSRRFLFVEESPARFRRVVVETGPEREGRVPVLSGIAPGARVVTDGSVLLASLLAGGAS